MAKILLVEDNTDLAAGLKANLEIEEHQVSLCHDGAQAFNMMGQQQPDLVILDVMLPNLDGFGVLQQIRRHNPDCAVLMLTARGEETDKVRALRNGADDYVTKPFGLMELLARVEALLRRSRAKALAHQGPVLLFQDVRLDPATCQVWCGKQQVSLTPKEYQLLLTLLDHANRVCSRQELLSMVWGHAGEVATRTVDTHMAELRRKLETNPAKPEFLLTARGIGYWLRWNQPQEY